MEKSHWRNLTKWLIKLFLSAIAIYWISIKVDFHDSLHTIIHISPIWLVVAFVLYNASQVIGAIRLNVFYRDITLHLQQNYVTKLYYLGMFYNLFLPGGIGGDGYKIYVLNRKFGTSVRTLIRTHIGDRFSGLVNLVAILLCLTLVAALLRSLYTYAFMLILGLIIIYPIHFLMLKLVGKSFVRSFLKTTQLSLCLQGLQLLCFYTLLVGFGVDFDVIVIYLLVFLLSSIASAIPFTFGGIGARELTFVLLAPYTSINATLAVGFSLIFFLITVASSLPGIFFGFDQNRITQLSSNSKPQQ